MSSLDPRTPVLVGIAQLNDRGGESEPIEFMSRAAKLALSDSGGNVANHIESVRVIKGIWRYRNPASLVAEELGLDGVHSGLTRMGGNGVYDLVAQTANEIQAGELNAAIICSAEVLRTARAKRAAGIDLVRLPETDGAAPQTTYGPDRSITSPAEEAAGVGLATTFYAMAENALRNRLGEDEQTHMARVAALWAQGSEVAATNPSAWIPKAQSPTDLATVHDRNRMVATPYPKMMTANLNVDQAAAVVMCSLATAEAAGISKDRWVFPLAGSGAADHWSLFDRYELDSSPAMRLVGDAVLANAGLSLDEVSMLDLYSCFPVAVQLAQRESNIPSERPWTITGGLTFAGGPLNSYCLHALARSVELLREQENSTALLTGNGGFFTKHSALVVGSGPPTKAFTSSRPQAEVDALPARPAPSTASSGKIETYTVAYGRQGIERAIVSVLDDNGARHLTNSTDPALTEALLSGDHFGVEVQIDHTTEVPTVLF